jgi:hypothetical protein
MIGKFLVWGACALGLIGFFLPMISVVQSGVTVELSAMTLVSGADKALEEAAKQAGDQVGASDKDKAEAKQMAKSVKGTEGAKEVTAAMQKLVLVMFAPTILLLLVSLIALKRYGRLLAVLALLAGIAGVGLWAIASGAVEGDKGGLGLGMTLVMAGGALGALGGIMGLIKPEPKAGEAAAA